MATPGRPGTPAPKRDDDGRTERALKLVYGVIVPRMLRDHVETKLGVAAPNYNRIQRTHEFYEAMAAELGDWWWRLAQDEADPGSGVRRLERKHHQDAGEELVDAVLLLPEPVRRVVEMRSAGLSWKKIAAALPDRAFFSVKEDWEVALNSLWMDCEPLIRRLV